MRTLRYLFFFPLRMSPRTPYHTRAISRATPPSLLTWKWYAERPPTMPAPTMWTIVAACTTRWGDRLCVYLCIKLVGEILGNLLWTRSNKINIGGSMETRLSGDECRDHSQNHIHQFRPQKNAGDCRTPRHEKMRAANGHHGG